MKKRQLVALTLLVMRITVVQLTLTFLFLGSLYANETEGQEILKKKISLSVTNLEISKVLAKVQEQTGVKFLYSSNTIQAERKISFNAADKQLGDFIREVIRPLSIDFRIVDGQVLLFPLADNKITDQDAGSMNDPAELISAPAPPVVTGTVTDDKGVPLAGATIMVKAKSNRITTTDNAGRFSLDIGSSSAILVISYTGFATQELSVTGDQVISVKLVVLEGNMDVV
ncbi:MAG: hypothetical protein EOO01_30290, partial [Chitinophagaceae bacterium]